jgi:uncharacterized delta-60 repeat protein
MTTRNWFRSPSNGPRAAQHGKFKYRRRFEIEALEDRCLPSGTPGLEITGADNVAQGTPYVFTLGPVTVDPGQVVTGYTVHLGDNTSWTFSQQTLSTAITHSYAYADVGPHEISVDIAVMPDGPFLGVATKTVTVSNVAPVASANVFARTGIIESAGRFGNCIAEDPTTGEIVVLSSHNELLRFSANGTLADISPLDQAFYPSAMAIDAFGRIIVGGGGTDGVVVRYLPDGSLDESFGNGGFATMAVDSPYGLALALDSQGRILIAGATQYDYNSFWPVIGRLTDAGEPDGSFGSGSGMVVSQSADGIARGIAEDPLTGKLVVLTSLTPSGDKQLLRYNSNGTLDISFGNGGSVIVDNYLSGAFYPIQGMDVDSAGRILIGFTGNRGLAAARYNTDGSRDTGFGTNGIAIIDYPQSVNSLGFDDFATSGLMLDAQGRILLSGYVRDFNSNDHLVAARLTATGDPDITFGEPGSGPTTTHAGFLATIAGPYVDGGQGADAPYTYAWNVTTDNGDIVPGLSGSLSEYTGRVPELTFTPIAEGHYTVTLTVTDRHGAVSPASTIVLTVIDDDVDADGLADSIDTVPATYSNNFTDGAISGSIITRGDQLLAIVDAPNSLEGVMITASAAGGSTPARISVDGGAALFYINAGDQLIVTHGSVIVRVLAGTVESTFVSSSGQSGSASLDAGNSLVFKPETFTFSAPATNTEPIEVIGSGGGAIAAVGPGETVIALTGVGQSGGVLYVGGTAAADVVRVSGGNLLVNGVAHSLSGVSEVHIWAREGNDQIDLTGLPVRSFIDGGQGNDTLTGGSGDDVILGGGGIDTITGSAGNDFLVGGDGADRIVGSAGHDILVAGDIGSELDLAALRAVSQAWAASRNVTGAAVDDFLDETVFTADAVDQLTGSAGADLFIINIGDKITDFVFGKPQANKDGDVVIRDGVVVS